MAEHAEIFRKAFDDDEVDLSASRSAFSFPGMPIRPEIRTNRIGIPFSLALYVS